ncbi:MAG: NADH-quinone oxidoreductase subunit M [Puniceicoccales bacterium]|nr:NADH-quinone oxidoreductase subunit M [Puniceicoccales bacterium]
MTACSFSVLAVQLPVPAGNTVAALPLLLLVLPVLGALFLAASPSLSEVRSRITGLAFSLTTLVLTLVALVWGMADNGVRFVFSGGAPTVFGAAFSLELSGKAMLFTLLTGIIAPMCLLASWQIGRARFFNLLFLLAQGAALGVFLAQNFFLWFLCWELSLFPAFFLIKIWGGANAGRAAYQFVIYTIGGSAFMLLAFAAVYATAKTLDFATLREMGSIGALEASLARQHGGTASTLVFLGVLLGLAVKVPMFPFHTWLPDTYAAAPTGVSMFLTAIMSKMGLYGFAVLLAPLFPVGLASATPWLIWLALAGIVLGAFAAARQVDIKRMIAYSSVNHLGYCLLALFAVAGASTADVGSAAAARSGFWLQMFNHGLSAAALFFCAGVIERRSGVRGIGDFGGVRKVAPVFAALCGVALFSSLGLPGLNGFVGEFLIFRGVFGFVPWAAAAAAIGLLVTAIFLLTFWQKVFHGPANVRTETISDLTRIEVIALAPVALLMVLFGILPSLLTGILGKLP